MLERWAHAAQQQGRLKDARKALEEAVAIDREQGRLLAAGRVLTRLGLVVHRLGDPQSGELIAEAVELLEEQPPGRELVSAYTYTAGRCTHVAQYAEAVAAAERALALAAEVGLPEPAFALSWRGLARCQLGHPGGVEDVRRALQLALEQGLGRETGVIYGLLAGVAWTYHGPQNALDTAAEGIDFCERRGITEMAQQVRANTIAALADVGQTEQALLEAGSLADRAEAAGDMAYVAPRALQLQLYAERGTAEKPPSPERFVEAVRDIGLPGLIALAFAAVAQLLLARRQSEQAQELLRELDQLDRARVDTDYVWRLPRLLRVALALDDRPLAQRLSAGVDLSPRSTNTPSHRPRRSSSRPRASKPTPPSSTPGRPSAGARSGTSPSAPTPCSARAAPWPRWATPSRRCRSVWRASSSRPWGSLRR